MASSLFGNDPKPTMLDKFDEFKRMIQGQDPKTIVEQLISSGRMSKQDFERYSLMARQFANTFNK